MIKIFNIRDGFANNSSSTHSIIFRSDGKTSNDNYGEDGFHWEFFTVNSEQGILDYLRATLKSNLSYKLHEDYVGCILDGWVGPSDTTTYDATVDHQSVISLPTVFDGITINKQFFDELKELFLSQNTLILGGNDNSDESHSLVGTDGKEPHFIIERPSMVGRKDPEYDYWTFFNRENGMKFRFVLNDNGEDQVFPERSSVPDLVDIKLTDHCEFFCQFCYQGSTPNGKHADSSHISGILHQLQKNEVFEIAYGGGEPTSHPNFVDILKMTRDHHIVPNFTTKNLKWLQDHINEVVDIIGSCAVSVMNKTDLNRIKTIRDFYDIPSHKICAQMVMGSVSEFSFKEILKTACELKIPLTLLGYKMTGRGQQFNRYEYSNWLETVKSVISGSNWYKIGVDTALVQQSQKEMLEAPKWLYHTNEGMFSWYIDAVAKTHGPSSYDVTKPYKHTSDIMENYSKYTIS